MQTLKSNSITLEQLVNKDSLIKFTLTLFILSIIATGAYESFAQKYLPDSSILSLLHRYDYLKRYAVVYEPSKGIWHTLAWTGSGMMVTMMLYSVRKRVAIFSYLGSLRHWLNAHILLGITGSILVTFHTTFKLGGIVSTAFWCMLVTVIFGILGRYIYVQIPRDKDGKELNLSEIDRMVQAANSKLEKQMMEAGAASLISEIDIRQPENDALNPVTTLIYMIRADIVYAYRRASLNATLRKRCHLSHKVREEIGTIVREKSTLIRRRNLLAVSHQLLHYWHVFHIPLAIVMFMIMFLHIGVYFIFGTT